MNIIKKLSAIIGLAALVTVSAVQAQQTGTFRVPAATWAATDTELANYAAATKAKLDPNRHLLIQASWTSDAACSNKVAVFLKAASAQLNTSAPTFSTNLANESLSLSNLTLGTSGFADLRLDVIPAGGQVGAYHHTWFLNKTNYNFQYFPSWLGVVAVTNGGNVLTNFTLKWAQYQ